MPQLIVSVLWAVKKAIARRAPRNLADQLTLFKSRGADYARHTTASLPEFKMLSTPLHWTWAFGDLAKLAFWVSFSIQKWKFCKILNFFVCQFLWWEVNLRRLRGKLITNPHPSKPCEFRALDERSYSRKWYQTYPKNLGCYHEPNVIK